MRIEVTPAEYQTLLHALFLAAEWENTGGDSCSESRHPSDIAAFKRHNAREKLYRDLLAKLDKQRKKS